MPTTPNPKTHKKSFMNRNVTQFRHFLLHSHINENDLNWTMSLRQAPFPRTQPSDMGAPQVASKTTSAFLAHIAKDPHIHCQPFLRLNQPQKQTLNQLNFYSKLGNNEKQKSKVRFQCQPFKDRNLAPQMLSKHAIKKIRDIDSKDMELALDGAHKQLPYTEKILANRNYGLLQPFVSNKSVRGKVSLPSLAWQVGLRNYR